jgi:hypothetical protein
MMVVVINAKQVVAWAFARGFNTSIPPQVGPLAQLDSSFLQGNGMSDPITTPLAELSSFKSRDLFTQPTSLTFKSHCKLFSHSATSLAYE